MNIDRGIRAVTMAWVLALLAGAVGCSRTTLDDLKRALDVTEGPGEAPPGTPPSNGTADTPSGIQRPVPGGVAPAGKPSVADTLSELFGEAGEVGIPELKIPANPDCGRPEIVFEFPAPSEEVERKAATVVHAYTSAGRIADYGMALEKLDELEVLLPASARSIRQLRAYTYFYEGQYRFRRLGEATGAIASFEKADALGPEFADHLKPWGMAAFTTGDHYSAIKHLEEYMDRGGASGDFAGALGQLYHDRNDDGRAIRYLKEHLSSHPGDPKAENLLARIQSEQVVTEGYTDRESAHFRVEFDGLVNMAAAYQLLNVMELAYRDVSRALDYTPREKTSLILFTGGSYRELAARGFAPDWSGGFFDGHKIRIPSEQATRIDDHAKNTLYHEYTHAVIHERAGRGENSIPRWLHEGVAQSMEPGNAAYQWRSFKPGKGMPPPTIKEIGSINWNAQNGSTAYYLYGQSLSFVKYLRTTFPPRKLMELVDAFAQGADTDAAFKSVYGVDSKELYDRWLRGLL